MTTPVLSQSEKNKSLSGNKSKKKKKEKLSTVLYGSGTFKAYQLIQSSAQILEQKISEVFSFVAPIKPKWSEMKKIPKAERGQFRKSLNQPTNPSKKYLIFGINAVMRAIEKGLCTVVLVTADVRPPLMLRHISDCCKIEKIPLIQVPMLRYILVNHFGFPGAILAIKEVPDNDPLHSVLDYLLECFPEMQDEITLLLQNLKLKSLEAQNAVDSEIFGNLATRTNSAKSSDHVESTFRSKVNPETIYLYRNDTKTRCFVPPTKDDLNNSFNSDFIAFDDEELAKETIQIELQKEAAKQMYKNLSVKRLQPNPERKKGKKKKPKKPTIATAVHP